MFGLGAEFWWAIVGLLLILSELLLPGVILVFFGFGALLTALLSWIIPAVSVSMQLIIFVVASIVSLLVLRRSLKHMFYGREKVSEEILQDGMIGARAVVKDAIAPKQQGTVKLNGAIWKAEADEALAEGARVEVVEQKSLLLVVKAK